MMMLTMSQEAGRKEKTVNECCSWNVVAPAASQQTAVQFEELAVAVAGVQADVPEEQRLLLLL